LGNAAAPPTTSAPSTTRPPPATTTTAPGYLRTTGAAPTPVPVLDHVVVVVLENTDYSAALADPNVARLAAAGGIATNYYAAGHPSLPNYLALDTGSTHGVTSDCTDCFVGGGDLAQQLSGAGVAWGAYFEAMPSACYLGDSTGSYAAKHDPFRYVDAVRSSTGLCSHLQPFGHLTSALSGGTLPRFVWVTPDICDDGHDCGVARAGTWLAGFASRLTASPAWTPRSALFVTWDEASDSDSRGLAGGAVVSGAGGGHVLTLVLSPGVRAGTRVATPLDHYSLLRTVEELLGLPLAGHAADPSTPDLGGFWK
jgi:hypothetical protein